MSSVVFVNSLTKDPDISSPHDPGALPDTETRSTMDPGSNPDTEPRSNVDHGSRMDTEPSSSINPGPIMDTEPAIPHEHLHTEDESVFLVSEPIRCVNCGIDVMQRGRHNLELIQVQSIIRLWIAPRPVSYIAKINVSNKMDLRSVKIRLVFCLFRLKTTV